MNSNLDHPLLPCGAGLRGHHRQPSHGLRRGRDLQRRFRRHAQIPDPRRRTQGLDSNWFPGAQGRLVGLIRSAAAGSTLYAETEQLDSPALEQALVAAAKRGVTVDLTMTYSASYAKAMDTLVAGGAHVSTYAAGAPLYIHAKAISVNGTTVYVGSANFTTAMTNADRNAGIITSDPAVAHGVTATMASDFAEQAPTERRRCDRRSRDGKGRAKDVRTEIRTHDRGASAGCRHVDVCGCRHPCQGHRLLQTHSLALLAVKGHQEGRRLLPVSDVLRAARRRLCSHHLRG